ncbi:MAG: cation:proton antiporter [bacterium]
MEFGILNDLVILFGVSLLVILVFNKIKIPAVVGFLLTGIMAGPYGLGLIKSIHEVDLLAEVGILLLLFTIGIEFSFKEIFEIKKSLIIGGVTQVAFTTITVSIISLLFVNSINEAIFIGFIAALSSTAIVIKIMSEKGEIDSPHGKTILAILIAQDIIAIPMILFVPYLAGNQAGVGISIPLLILKALLILVMVFVLTKYIIPYMLYQIAKTRIRELFLISILVICFGIVWISGSLGISVALGAFIAGLIISESEFSHQALGNILPFRDVFLSIFFVSIGMLLNTNYVFDNVLLIISLTLLVLILKSGWGIASTLLLKYPIRTAVLVGLSISQIGEFSFVIAKSGMSYKILNEANYQLFLSISILTIGLSPFLIRYAGWFADKAQKHLGKKGTEKIKNLSKTKLKDHLIIIGYGVTGGNLSQAAITSKIPYIVLELNPDTVAKEKKKGIPIYYGDASYDGVLRQLNTEEARIMVIAINDPYAIRRIVSSAKNINPNIHLIVRTRHISETNSLLKLGADEVIPEEYETSIEIFTRVLLKYLVPLEEIDNFTDEIRANSYKLFRAIPKKVKDREIGIPEITISSIKIGKKCTLINKNLQELDFRNNYKAAILFVRKGKELITNPNGDYTIIKDDIVYLICEPTKINELRKLLNGK